MTPSRAALQLLSLSPLRSAADWVLLAFRVFVGAFLIWGVWDNVTSSARMLEFASFLRQHRFAYPHLMAQLSVWAQLACGIAMILGLLTRWAGLVCAFNFLVALWMVDAANGIRAAFPAAMLVFFGLMLATRGAGRLSLDAAWFERASAAAMPDEGRLAQGR